MFDMNVPAQDRESSAGWVRSPALIGLALLVFLILNLTASAVQPELPQANYDVRSEIQIDYGVWRPASFKAVNLEIIDAIKNDLGLATLEPPEESGECLIANERCQVNDKSEGEPSRPTAYPTPIEPAPKTTPTPTVIASPSAAPTPAVTPTQKKSDKDCPDSRGRAGPVGCADLPSKAKGKGRKK